MNKWEKFCDKINKRKFESELQYEDALVDYFELIFGWELDRQVSIQMGHATKYADIILKHHNKYAIVIEVKQPNIPIDERAAGQLRSYMRQKSVEFGLLIGEKISVFFDDFDNRSDDPVKLLDIPIKQESENGKRLSEVIDYSNYSENGFRIFCKDLLRELDIKKSAEYLVEELTSQSGKMLIMKALKNSELAEKYNDLAIERALNEINICRKPYAIQQQVRNPIKLERTDRDQLVSHTKTTGIITGGKKIELTRETPLQQDLGGTKPQKVSIGDIDYPISKWYELLVVALSYLAKYHESKLEELADNPNILSSGKRLAISRKKEDLRRPYLVPNTNIYVETNIDAAHIVERASKTIKYINDGTSIYVTLR